MGNGDGDEMGDKTIQNHEQEERRLGLDLQLMCTLREGGASSSSSTSGEGEDERNGDEEGDSCFPEEVLEHVLGFIKGHKDRNSVSAVCKSWFKVEACCREHVFIGNCYAASPSTMIKRFPKVKSLTLKGKPRFADFNLVPRSWGAYASSWVSAMGSAYPKLESLSLKRMTITDDDLELIATSFPKFKDLTLFYCDGFSTRGLASIVANCRELRRLDLNEVEITHNGVDWLSCFPETTTTLVCLGFDCLDAPVNFDALEKLVARSPFLKELRLNSSVSIFQLHRLMLRSSQLTHLGTGSFSTFLDDFMPEQATILQLAFNECKSLESLSGFQYVIPEYLPAIYPVCNNLVDLNLSYAVIDSGELEQIVSKCPKLQRLWVLDSVEDAGLWATAATCKDLRDLRVFPMDAREDGQGSVSDVGLAAIAEGCPNLQSILYFCQRMTNAAVVTMSKNCPKLASFRLCIMGRHKPDHVTGEPMDEGFGAIVMNCKKLTRFAVSGQLTNKTFEYIGTYGKSLETLSVAFAGENDMAMEYVLNGCKHLRKLEIRDSPFGDSALLSGLHHYKNMRFLWMSSCKVSLEACMELARRMPKLNVEIIRENGENDDTIVEKLYAYRSVAGHRSDMPSFVITL